MMIKTEEIPTTKIIHKIYCDDCGKYITASEECKDKFYAKLENALLRIGFKRGDNK